MILGDYSPLLSRSSEATVLLRMMANERRLLLLCHMLGEGEITVGTLAERVGLSQSATSQHLNSSRSSYQTRGNDGSAHGRVRPSDGRPLQSQH